QAIKIAGQKHKPDSGPDPACGENAMTAREDFAADFRRLRAQTGCTSAELARRLAERDMLKQRNRDPAAKEFLVKRWQSRLSAWGKGNDLPHAFEPSLKPALILMHQLVAEKAGITASVNAAALRRWEVTWHAARQEPAAPVQAERGD